MTPELRQFGTLTAADFDRVPVWAGCHTVDYDEPWYDRTDEETFRPWTGALPVDFATGMFLVRATFRLPDGRTFRGFATPAAEPDDLGTMQPHLFAGGRTFGFWGGMVGVPGATKAAFAAAVGGAARAPFPIGFECDPGLAAGHANGVVRGFYRLPQLGSPPVVDA